MSDGPRAEPKLPHLMGPPATWTFRIGPREFVGAVCKCGAVATYMLARPYDLSPKAAEAEPSCAEHAAGFPPWVTPASRRATPESETPNQEGK